jgi:hypothetical protein
MCGIQVKRMMNMTSVCLDRVRGRYQIYCFLIHNSQLPMKVLSELLKTIEAYLKPYETM